MTVICFFLNVLQRRYYGRKRSHTFKRYGSYKNVWYLKGSDSFLKDMVHLKRYDTNTAGKFKKVSYQPKSDLKFTFLNYDCFSLVVKVEPCLLGGRTPAETVANASTRKKPGLCGGR